MSYETILTDEDNGILTITLNRPERLNAWTYQMGGELAQAITEANANDDIIAIVVTGAGRGFCAGADIEAVFKAQAEQRGNAREGAPGAARGARTGDYVEMIRASKPIVAAINGAAIGVGLTQVLPMDLLLAARGAKLSVRFIKMGLVPELASSHYLALRVGFGNASELMLTGKTITAEEAHQIGLVDKLVEPGELLKAAKDAARAMGENPQTALKMVKQLLSQNVSEGDTRLVQQRETAALTQCYASPEHKEAISAFLEKRDPNFKLARAKS
jgi:2-(1,2-epoxy-1,2-dihydrophenyl)acetyl-CoA isomerase